MIRKLIPEKELKTIKRPEGLDMAFEGTLKEAVQFIERNQLYDVSLWKKFVEVFRVRDDGRGDWYVSWRSEYWGKMMRGAAMVTRYTKNREIYRILEDSVRDLLTAQDELGRISGYRVEEEFSFWDLWGRKYVMLGLMYFMEICEDEALNAQILQAMCRHADYVLEHVGPDKLDIRKTSKHWEGMNACSILEPTVRLYRLTGKKRYLDFAEYIISTGFILSDNIIELSANNVSPHDFPVVKAYEMMSCFEGLLQYYYLTGNEHYKTALINFGENILRTELSVIGCSGCTHELFDHTAVRQTQTDYEGIVQETCVTVTWMKLASQLLELTGNAEYADRIEQSFYNAYRGSFNTERVPVRGSSSHGYAQVLPFDSYSPLTADRRGRKTGGFNLLMDNTFYGCCACIAAAGAGVIPEIALMTAGDGLTLNHYEAGVIRTKTPAGAEAELRLVTDYPYDGRVKITLGLQESEEFVLRLRVPGWCDKATVAYGGAERKASSGYAECRALWKDGDEILLTLPMAVKQVLPPEGAVNREIFAAYTYGPLVLAADKRLTDPDAVLSPVLNGEGYAESERVLCPEICEAKLCLAVPLVSGGKARLVDYASAGKTWTDESRMAAWIRRK